MPYAVDPKGAEQLWTLSGQLDRQRHPVQPGHQPRHPGSGLVIEREVRIGGAGPVREQCHRLRPAAVAA
jgi:hypothetical protein